MTKQILTQERLKHIVSYDQDTGIFVWKNPYNKSFIGNIAGGISEKGYIRITINNRKYMAHRLVWLYVYGVNPENEIDHINGIKNDNRLVNLRPATHAQNGQNKTRIQTNNTTGYSGVSLLRGLYCAAITTSRKRHYIGSFQSALEAHEAYLEAKRRMHPFCTI